MKLDDLCNGILPSSTWWRVERQQVAEYHELGHRVCSWLHGHGENRGDEQQRQAAIGGSWWLAGYRPWDKPEQLTLDAA